MKNRKPTEKNSFNVRKRLNVSSGLIIPTDDNQENEQIKPKKSTSDNTLTSKNRATKKQKRKSFERASSEELPTIQINRQEKGHMMQSEFFDENSKRYLNSENKPGYELTYGDPNLEDEENRMEPAFDDEDDEESALSENSNEKFYEYEGHNEENKKKLCDGTYIVVIHDNKLYGTSFKTLQHNKEANTKKVFHHSHLSSGKEVKFSGEMHFEKGKLIKITNNSGHYKLHLHEVIEALYDFLSQTLKLNFPSTLKNKLSEEEDDNPYDTIYFEDVSSNTSQHYDLYDLFSNMLKIRLEGIKNDKKHGSIKSGAPMLKSLEKLAISQQKNNNSERSGYNKNEISKENISVFQLAPKKSNNNHKFNFSFSDRSEMRKNNFAKSLNESFKSYDKKVQKIHKGHYKK